jgi:hypothetical protein
MTESTAPQTPEEEAALHALAIKHRRRHWWIALYASVTVSVHTTLLLHTLWDGWPLQERDVVLLAFFGVNALVGLGWLAWACEACAETRPWIASGRCSTCVGGPRTVPGTTSGRRARSPWGTDAPEGTSRHWSVGIDREEHRRQNERARREDQPRPWARAHERDRWRGRRSGHKAVACPQRPRRRRPHRMGP